MSTKQKAIINVQGTTIGIISSQNTDFISLTDMVKNFDGGTALIEQWLKNKDTVLFLGIWEQINNPDFNSLEFEGIKIEAGRNSFYLSAKKWIKCTQARGIISSAGRYGGTYAHKDIAFEFGSWLSPEFKLYLIKEFQRLKEEENYRLSSEWSITRTLSRLNYRIHTDAIKSHVIPTIKLSQINYAYANEADMPISITKILIHLGEEVEAPKMQSARAPPDDYQIELEQEFVFDPEPDYQIDQTVSW